MSESPKVERDPLKLLDLLVAETAQYGLDVAESPIGELAPRSSWAAAVKAVRTRIEELQETIDLAWGLIANAGTHSGRGWNGEGVDWQHAAIKWRDRHYLGSQANPRRPRELEIVMGGQADRVEGEPGRAIEEKAEVAGIVDQDPIAALERFVTRGQAAQAAVDEILEPHDPGARRRDRAPLEPLKIVEDRTQAELERDGDANA